MNLPTLPLLQNRYRSSAAKGYLSVHPLGQVVRSLFASSLLWIFIATAVYFVYSLLAPVH
jgi:hypothetical protein